MDALWHKAILYTDFYSKLLAAINQSIKHDSAGAKDDQKEQRQKRLDRMKQEYKGYFGSEYLQLQFRDIDNNQSKKRKVDDQSSHGGHSGHVSEVKSEEVGMQVGDNP